MKQNSKPQGYSIKTANISFMVLLIGNLILSVAGAVYVFATGQEIDVNLLLVLNAAVFLPSIVIALVSARAGTALRFRKAPGVKNTVFVLILAFFASLAVSAFIALLTSGLESGGVEIPPNSSEFLFELPPVVTLLVICVQAHFAEEIVFRGVMQIAYERKFGAVAVVIAALLFSWTHVDPISIVGVLPVGLLLGYTYYKTRSMWIPIIFHGVYNLLVYSGIPDAIVALPWTWGLFPKEGMHIGDINFILYTVGMLVVGALMIYAVVRLIQLKNSDVRSEKEEEYVPELGGTAPFIISLVLLVLFAFLGILYYIFYNMSIVGVMP